MKKALITGIYGQDGSYLAELLLSKNYEVHGIVKSISLEDPNNKPRYLKNCKDNLVLHAVSLNNQLGLIKIINKVKPDEFYHLAASSFVNYTFDNDINVIDTNFYSTYFLLSILKDNVPECKIFFAGSSEMFGHVLESPQNENTPFNPRSLYGISKLASYHLMRNYREQYDMFCCTGILYNHESPRRSFEYVTRKITSSVARIKLGLLNKLALGTLEPLRDWGYAPAYVKAMWLMLQQKFPTDYVLATGITHSVREFVEYAFYYVGLDYRDYVVYDEKFYRPVEKIPLCGDSSKAYSDLKWQNTKSLKEIIQEMVDHDLNCF
jgi:GDPmannose 4,6-dehydratase